MTTIVDRFDEAFSCTVAGCSAILRISGISDSGSALVLILVGLVLVGFSTVAGCPALCNAGISVSGSTDVTNVGRDFFEDSSNAGGTVDEPPACEVDQKTVGT